jgi:hypothetical protein
MEDGILAFFCMPNMDENGGILMQYLQYTLPFISYIDIAPESTAPIMDK